MARQTTIVGNPNVPSLGKQTYPIKGSAKQVRQSNGKTLPNVAWVRRELSKVLPAYRKIKDCLAGADAVKAAGEVYLPRPNAEDTSLANRKRYDAYLARAVFYNVAFRTAKALVGQIFLRDPQIDVPAGLEPLMLNANGENITLEQVAMDVCLMLLTLGRSGLFVDFPTAEGTVTRAMKASGDYNPTLRVYEPSDCINWRTAKRGSNMVLTMVVLREDYHAADDGFEVTIDSQYRVLRLVGSDIAVESADYLNNDGRYDDAINAANNSAPSDVYEVSLWRKNGNNAVVPVSVEYPRDASGKFLNKLPFMFAGADKNDASIDQPPVADLVEVNIGHFRNSADYEETSFMTGQPTPYVTGVTEEWNNNVLKGKIQLGSRAVIPLPIGAAAGLLQAEANGVPFEGMQAKERQMVALGAKLVEQRQVQRTATEAQLEGASDTSILAKIAQNGAAAILWALKTACQFTGDDDGSVKFSLNTEFDLTRLDPADRQQIILEWQAGAITYEEMRSNLRRGGIATLPDADAKNTTDKEQKERLDKEVEKTKLIAAATPQPAKQPA